MYSRINPYGLVEICEVIISHITNKNDAVEFLEKLSEKVKICEEAVWYTKVLQGNIYLSNLNNLEETKKVIESLREVLEEAGNVTPVHGKYYMLASQYYRRVGDHSNYYKCGLQFLGCSIDSFPEEEWPEQAFYLGLAALLGEGVFNIGELLAHPILDSLKGTENEWLVELLKAFNFGDIKKFNAMKPIWGKIPDLLAQEVALRRKISLLCLMEMTFKRSAKNRSIPFSEIARETQLPDNEVEILIMKALAQGLVRGEIDQVDGVVNMTWVQPRVLDRPQITRMATNLENWMASITSMEILMEQKAGDILTN